jgi:peptide/nickel transport system permease protein
MRRVLLAIPVLLLSSLVVFGLMRIMPGDALTALMAESGNVSPRELQKLRKDLRLDLPYHEQYLHWVWQMVTFNPGRSVFTGDAIATSLKKSIPVTIELAAMAIVFGVALAIPLGVLSATRQDKLSDYIGRLVAISGLSFPDFWLGTLIITFAAIWFSWMPPLGYTSLWESPWRNLQQFVLPAAVLGLRLSAATMRMTRSTLLEVLREDYVRTAWAKGLGERLIIYKHALKNALIPVVTIVGGQLGTLLGDCYCRDHLCTARDGAADCGSHFISGLPGGADQRHAGGWHPGHIKPTGGSDLRLAGSTHSVSIKASLPGESDVNSNHTRLCRHLTEDYKAAPSTGPVESYEAQTARGRGGFDHSPHRVHGDFRGCAGAL